jgi:hypothetical protein
MPNNYEWLSLAKRRWPNQVVGGSGRFAVVTPHAGPLGKILLFESRDEARAIILDPKRAHIVDLGGLSGDELLAKIPDRETPEERRERRREQREQRT